MHMNHLEDAFYFLIRHTPFWAIPLAIVSLEAFVIYKRRKNKKIYLSSLFLMIFCLMFLVGYFWLGGPENFGRSLKKLF